MAALATKVRLYLEANGKDMDTEFLANRVIVLDNSDGKGPFIHTWNVDGLSKPTDSQLDSYDSAGDTFVENEKVRNTRKAAYGDIGEQLDEIYKDIDAWKTRIKKIKDDNPKG
tara:strand:- start:63 stop:401 length:339 start_codon:yes stop_codon:yes gene_type:complete